MSRARSEVSPLIAARIGVQCRKRPFDATAALLQQRQLHPQRHRGGRQWYGRAQIAEELGDRDYQLRSLRGLHIFYSRSDFRKTLEIARRFCLVAEQQPDKNDRPIGDGLGESEHVLGDQTSARAHIEHMLANFSAPDHRSRSYANRFQFDQHAIPRLVLARILWLQGFPDQAMRTAEDAVRDALEPITQSRHATF
jgi:hypothetical protein